MVTIFTIPRAFTGSVAQRQNNAIRSWMLLEPTPEVLLFCDDTGIKEAATEHGCRYVPELKRSESGIPLVNDAFAKAQVMASNDLISYVNCDILLTQSWLNVFLKVAEMFKGRFLVIGRRVDVKVEQELDFSGNWESELNGTLHSIGGNDYFAFWRGTIRPLPPFRVGAWAWDWAITGQCQSEGTPVVDASEVAKVYHQNHQGRHKRDSVDAQTNRSLLKQSGHDGTADWILKEGWRLVKR